MNKVETVVVCDTGPILHLDELECLDLLRDFHQVILPESVVQELERHCPQIFKDEKVVFDIVAEPASFDYEILTLCRMLVLHAGEIEALCVMKQYPDAIFLTDDSAARLVGKQLGYRVHGTLGVLIRTIRRKLMSPQKVVDRLRMIPHKSILHIKPSLLESVIQQIEEEFDL